MLCRVILDLDTEDKSDTGSADEEEKENLLADEDINKGCGQGVEYHIGKFSNADISDFSVSQRVYRVESPISSVFDKLGEGRAEDSWCPISAVDSALDF